MEVRREDQLADRRPIAAPEMGHVPIPALDAAERNLAALRDQYERDREELLSLRGERAALRARLAQSEEAIREARREAARHAQSASRLTGQLTVERERADALGGHLKHIHHALFVGHVHDFILRACLALTGATRGAYIQAPPSGPPRVRARIGMEASPGGRPSRFVSELAERARLTQDAFVCNDGVGHDGQPRPRSDDERFRNYAVAPIVLMGDLDGVIVVADKPDGQIDEKDMSMLVSIGDQASVAVENARLRRELEGAYLSTVSLLADAAEARDAYTHGHCETVSRMARHTAAALGMDDDGVRLTCYAALLHDIGKIGVSDGILHKPGPLLPEERELMRSHVRVGYDLLRAVPALADVAEVVLRHHEWWDGNGYPSGMQGDAIPLPARVVAVVDAYCAMVDRRSYKEALADAEARAELQRCAGTQFDPLVVEKFVEMLDDPRMADQDGDFYAECGLPPLLKATH
jgi:putative nucleotidyltransferase with HDIG domain